MNKGYLKLGIIGLSEGNGHPFSWSSIFNGYEKKLMKDCGFPAIPIYLSKQNFPKDCIKNAEVSHIWTQNYQISEKIAKTCRIKNISKNYSDMVGKVDALLLARDDAENHLKFCLPYLEAGIPIYIDKPFSLKVSDANKILSYQKFPGQIFTCSALLFADEFKLKEIDLEYIGKIKSIEGISPKSWDKYSVHLIDPIFQIIKDKVKVKKHQKFISNNIHRLNVIFENDIDVQISTYGNLNVPIMLKIYGKKNNLSLKFNDPFSAFKKALECFVESVRSGEQKVDFRNLIEVVRLIELGR